MPVEFRYAQIEINNKPGSGPRPYRQLPLRHRENSASGTATRSGAAGARTISKEAR